MENDEMSWRDAIFKIMRKVNRPIHYSDITRMILDKKLKTTAGMTPHFTVAGEISRMRSEGTSIVRTEPGVYSLQEDNSTSQPPLPRDVVGKTAALENGLFDRLNYHRQQHVWSGKWERFSWFGIRRVNENGEMVDVEDPPSPEVVTALMEAVLIETLRPSFNRQQGNYMGTLYQQASTTP